MGEAVAQERGASGPSARWPRFGPMAAALAAAVALVPRAADLGGLSFWFDEVIAVTIAGQPTPGAVVEALGRLDRSAAPLHPLALHFWMRRFGRGEAAARALSALCGALAVGAIGLVAARAFDDRAAWAAALLAALSPVDVHYGREARMYALLSLETGLAWLLLFSFRRAAPAWRVGLFGLTLAAMLLTHPLATFHVAALAAAYAIDRRATRLRPAAWAAAHVVAAVAVAPWFAHYLGPGTRAKRPPLTPEGYVGWLREFTGGPWWLVLVLLGLAAWAVRRAARDADANALRSAAMLAAWLAIPPAALISYSALRTPIFGPIRYVLACGPAYLILVGWAITRLPRGAALAGMSALAVLAAATIPARAFAPTLKADWRWAAGRIAAIDPGASVVVGHGEMHMAMTVLPYYLDGATRAEPAGRSRDVAGPSFWHAYDRFDPTIALPRDLTARYRLERSERRAQVVLEHWVAAESVAEAADGAAARR